MPEHTLNRNLRIGVDLGGTKIEAVALDPDGNECLRRRVPTPREDYRGTIAAIQALVAGIEQELGARGTVGLGIPGAISPRTGRIKNANSQWLNGRPFDRDLAEALARPVRLANDANCLALSEATDGAAAGLPVVFGVILGTGVGGGIALAGRPHVGQNAIGGEWGHTPLPWPVAGELPGPPCFCGHNGCIETWLSGPGAAAEFLAVTGRTLSMPEIAAAASAGDGESLAALDRYGERLGRALAVIVDILDPDAIVLGGGLSNIDRLYEILPEHLNKLCFSDAIDTPVLRARHGDSSGVRGAAWLWPLSE